MHLGVDSFSQFGATSQPSGIPAPGLFILVLYDAKFMFVGLCYVFSPSVLQRSVRFYIDLGEELLGTQAALTKHYAGNTLMH